MISSHAEILKIIKEFVPEKFWPDDLTGRQLTDYGLVTTIEFVPENKFALLAGSASGYAVCMNWGKLYKQSKLKDKEELAEKSKDSHAIWLNEETAGKLTYLELAFVILHEIGHVKWNISPEEALKYGPQNQEVFADLFAHDILKAAFTAEVAEVLTLLCGPKDGWAASPSKETFYV